MENFSEKCKIYLKRKKFILGIDTPRHSKILWTDAIVAFIYSAVSMILIWLDGADVIVLGLNILCLIRAIISNKLNEYDTDTEKYNRYSIRIIIICMAAFYSIVVWCILMLEFIKAIPISMISIYILKIFTTIAILVVLGNDWEDIVIYAFSATVHT